MTSEEFDKSIKTDKNFAPKQNVLDKDKSNKHKNAVSSANKTAHTETKNNAKKGEKQNTQKAEKPAQSKQKSTSKQHSGQVRAQNKQATQKLLKEMDNATVENADVNALADVLNLAENQIELPENTKKSGKKGNNLKVMFLGGIGEIGKNMTVLEYGKDIIVIDCGVMFPSTDMLGIDLVVPDITYLVENKDKIRGFVITHGHEDHIGSVPYVVNEIKAPIYASKMTCGLIKKKMDEHKKVEYKTIAVKPKQKITLGCFEIEFIHVNHAIPGAFALAIKTPVGMVVHTGDYKIDLTPIYDEPFDFYSFAELGKKGVLLYMSDSTNAERPGMSLS